MKITHAAINLIRRACYVVLGLAAFLFIPKLNRNWQHKMIKHSRTEK